MKTTTLELFKENQKFSAAHFTIFGAQARERLHGHNFNVYAALKAAVSADGMVLDYRVYKKTISQLCDEWDERLLLPGRSPNLKIDETETHIVATFARDTMSFPKGDVIVLPIANVTVEELASVFLQKLVQFRDAAGHTQIAAIRIKVSSGPGQCASAEWGAW